MNSIWNRQCRYREIFQDKANKLLGNLQNIDMFKVLEASLREMKEFQKIYPEANGTIFIEMEEKK
jgi:hypothetical protein